jgi:hypothetical protein
MGYTHYWDFFNKNYDEKSWKKGIQLCKKIVKSAPKGLLGDWDGEGGTPTITEDSVRFNGVGEHSHETCAITKEENGSGFCKTNVKPYDAYVTACLIAMKFSLGEGARVRSDGRLDGFQDGLEIFNQVTKKEVQVSYSKESGLEVTKQPKPKKLTEQESLQEQIKQLKKKIEVYEMNISTLQDFAKAQKETSLALWLSELREKASKIR